MIVAVTGHRPNKLGGDRTERALVDFAVTHLYRYEVNLVYTGMALGWDLAVAEACSMLNVPYVAAVPFRGQSDFWPRAQRERYEKLLAHSVQAKYVSDAPYRGPEQYQRRNEWMVDRAEYVLALWDGSSGGTANCIAYAKRVGKTGVNVWPRWYSTMRSMLDGESSQDQAQA